MPLRTPRKPKKRRNENKSALMGGAPMRKAVVIKVVNRKPKKPNSAQRKVALCKLTWNNAPINAYIPGIGHNLQQHSVIMVRPKKRKDIGIKYDAVRGVYDLAGVENRISARSKYGTKKPKDDKD